MQVIIRYMSVVKLTGLQAVTLTVSIINVFVLAPASWFVRGVLYEIKEVREDVKTLESDLHELALHVAENYERKD